MAAISLRDYQRNCRPGDLTIVSVSFGTARLLRRNLELTRALNPGARLWWIVVENSGDEAERRLLDDADGFVVVPGTRLTEAERGNVGYGSFHHAKSLNIGFSYATSDTILSLDPDCFIVLRDWIDRVRRLMAERGYVFWGTPYHPERLSSFSVFGRTYMYFPTAICMFVDRAALQRRHLFDLDFTPDSDGAFNRISYHSEIRQLVAGYVGGVRRSRLRASSTLFRHHGFTGLRDALRLNPGPWAFDRRRDIGNRIWRRYHRTVPHGHTSIHYARPLPPLFRWWRWLVPQSLVAYPKRPGYWRADAFPFLPAGLAGPGRWEQFWLGDEPFAIHVGKVTYAGEAGDADTVDRVLEAAVRVAEPRPEPSLESCPTP